MHLFHRCYKKENESDNMEFQTCHVFLRAGGGKKNTFIKIKQLRQIHKKHYKKNYVFNNKKCNNIKAYLSKWTLKMCIISKAMI